MLWNTKKEIPIGSGSRNRKSTGCNAGRTCRRRWVDEQEFVFEEGQQSEIEDNSDRQPHRAVLQGEDQEEIGSKHRDREQRQQFRLAVAVKKQARREPAIGPESSAIAGDNRLRIRRRRKRQIAMT